METLSVTLRQQNCICILDPTLVLGKHGLQGIYLTKYLGKWIELWIVYELWRTLDNTQFYLEHLQEPVTRTQPITADLLEVPSLDQQAIEAWEQVRLKSELAGCQFHWIGDAVCQSRLPAWMKEGTTAETQLQRYEILSRALVDRLQLTDIHNPLMASCRDTVALAATLGCAFILSVQPSADAPPYLIQFLEGSGLSCQQQSTSDPIVAIERDNLHHLFVQAGLPQLLWSKQLHLAVIHVHVPAAADPSWIPDPCQDETATEQEDFNRPWELDNLPLPPLDINLWQDTQVFWYPLNSTSVMSPIHAHLSAVPA